MKKNLLVIAALVFAMAFAGCSKKDDSDKKSDKDTDKTTAEDVVDDEKDADDEDVDPEDAEKKAQVLFETDDEEIVFVVDRSYKLEEDAWLGVIPTGTIYTKEIDADEYDIAYTYCSNLDDNKADVYRFAFDKEYFMGIEDGIYDMVLCSSDDGEKGVVLLQVGIEKHGENIVFDYENEK